MPGRDKKIPWFLAYTMGSMDRPGKQQTWGQVADNKQQFNGPIKNIGIYGVFGVPWKKNRHGSGGDSARDGESDGTVDNRDVYGDGMGGQPPSGLAPGEDDRSHRGGTAVQQRSRSVGGGFSHAPDGVASPEPGSGSHRQSQVSGSRRSRNNQQGSNAGGRSARGQTQSRGRQSILQAVPEDADMPDVTLPPQPGNGPSRGREWHEGASFAPVEGVNTPHRGVPTEAPRQRGTSRSGGGGGQSVSGRSRANGSGASSAGTHRTGASQRGVGSESGRSHRSRDTESLVGANGIPVDPPGSIRPRRDRSERR